jgi:hypothetical protein
MYFHTSSIDLQSPGTETQTQSSRASIVADERSHVTSQSEWLKIQSLPSLSSVSKGSSYQSWIPYDIPELPKHIIIENWSLITAGTNISIRKIQFHRDGEKRYACLKLFKSERKESYDRESSAYALLIHRGVRQCIPSVRWKGAFPLSHWEGRHAPSKEEEIQYGLVMEYFEDYDQVEFSNLGVLAAEAIGRALGRIHEARVGHGDIDGRNTLFVREAESVRVVWMDFSFAWVHASEEVMAMEWDAFVAKLEFNMVIHRC